MLVNAKNLQIAKHCGKRPLTNGTRIDLFHFTDTGTMAADAHVAFMVSSLGIEPGDCRLSHDKPEIMANDKGEMPIGIPLNALRRVHPDAVPKLPVIPETLVAEITISAELLLKIAQAAKEFDGTNGAIRISFHEPDQPVTFDMKDGETGQTWRAILMPQLPKAFDAIETEIETAMRLAQELMG